MPRKTTVQKIVTRSPIENSQSNEEAIQRLKKAKDRVARIRKRIAKGYLELLAAVADLPGNSAAQRKASLSEVGVGRAEATRLLKAAKNSDRYADILATNSCQPDVIDAVLCAREDVRALALGQLAAGYDLEKSGVRRIGKAINDAEPNAVLRRNIGVVNAQASLSAKARTEAFRQEVRSFLHTLILFEHSTAEGDDLSQLTTQIRERAGHIDEAMLGVFDVDRVGDVVKYLGEAERINGILSVLDAVSDEEAIEALQRGLEHNWTAADLQFAEAVLAVRRIAAGDMYRIDLVDEWDRNIELGLLRKIAWLCGADLSAEEAERDAYFAAKDTALASWDESEDGMVYHQSEQPILRSLEICAGAGGEALGLQAAGFRPLGVFEQSANAINTLIANDIFGPLHRTDIRAFDFSVYRGKVDLLAGGVPCQPFSSLGNRRRENDPRDLFSYAVEIVKAIRPKALMLENVLPFVQTANSFYRAEICGELQKAGYETRLVTLYGSDLGLAQNRPRAVLVAFRDGLMSRFRPPRVYSDWQVTVGQVLHDLMAERGWKGADAWRAIASKVGPTIVGAVDDKSQGFACFRQLDDWKELGITARELAPEGPSANDPEDLIPGLTLKMGARLQGFPDDWRFQGTAKQQRAQIANAFPPVMAAAIGLSIHDVLTGTRTNHRAVLNRLRFDAGRVLPKVNDGDHYPDQLRPDVEQGTASRKARHDYPATPGKWFRDRDTLSDLLELPLKLGLPLGDVLEIANKNRSSLRSMVELIRGAKRNYARAGASSHTRGE